MSTSPQEGGRRPIDQILSAGFVADVEHLDLGVLRERRHLAEQEEVDLSYARRLLQGRIDVLTANAAPAGARTDADLAHDLAEALTEDGPRADHGLGRHLNVDPSRVGEHRRAAEQAVATLTTGSASEDVDAAVETLRGLERDVSESRHRVQQVMDVLTAEVARRYRTGEARVEDVLTVE